MSFKQLTTIIYFLLITASLSAQVPNTINYQGRLTDASGSPVADGAYLVKFIIYDAPTAGTDLWNTGFQTINTVDGLFSYQLGSNVVLPNGIFSDTSRYLGLTIGTDSELSPRTRFSPSSYAFNADNVAWSNISSVPAGFADGIDDEGLSQAAADADYVNVTGDDMTGDLRGLDSNDTLRVKISGSEGGIKTYGSNGPLMNYLFAYSYGELQMFDGYANVAVDLGAGFSNAAFLDLYGTNAIHLNTRNTGNSSVVLPNDAINNTEILDEPGIAQGKISSTSINVSGSTSMKDIVTITITTPAPGYVVIEAKAQARLTETLLGNMMAFQIDKTQGGNIDLAYYYFVGFNAETPSTSSIYLPVSCKRTYYESSAGSYTYRLEALDNTSNGDKYMWNPVITATYFPTSYGTVSTTAPDPNGDPEAKLVTITDQDGNTQQGYEIDLRNLELKVKEAQLKAQQAEMELIKAQQRQNSNEQ